MQFEGIVDRSQAERMRGIELEAEAVDIPGKLWVHELVGATVFDIDGHRTGLRSGPSRPIRPATSSSSRAAA